MAERSGWTTWIRRWSGTAGLALSAVWFWMEHGKDIAANFRGWHLTAGGAFLLVGLALLLVWAVDAFRKVRAFVRWVGSNRQWDGQVFPSLEEKITAMVNQRIEYAVGRRVSALEEQQRKQTAVPPPSPKGDQPPPTS